MKYILAGGGTGGHVFPAIAIADEIKEMDVNAEILFIGAKGRIEEKLIPENNYKLETISLSGFDRRNLKSNLGLPWKSVIALRDCRRIIKSFNPSVVIGTGGFVSGPVVYMGFRMNVPTMIQEGNSFPGKTVKFLSSRVDKVVVNFEETKHFLKRTDNVIRIPHPIRSSLRKLEKNAALEYFNLSKDLKTVFVFGGSQGARGINEAVAEIAGDLAGQNINLIWQTGLTDHGKYKADFQKYSGRIKVLKFIDKMDYAYSASDIVICRSGITSIMELAHLNAAAVLVPFPYASENHQEKNARTLERKNAAVVILQSELKEKLYKTITELLNDERKILDLRTNINSFSDSDAAKKIAAEAIKLIRN